MFSLEVVVGGDGIVTLSKVLWILEGGIIKGCLRTCLGFGTRAVLLRFLGGKGIGFSSSFSYSLNVLLPL